MGKHQHTPSQSQRMKRLRGLESLESRELLTVAVEPAADISQSAWVKRLYLDVLGRPAGDPEATYWVERLNSGVTKATIAQSIIDGRERRSGAINDYYQKVLGRDVDPAGLEFWLGVWDRTGGPEVVRASLIGSGEYFQKAGGTNQKAIQSLYNDLLRRTAGPSEEQYWLNVMTHAALSNVAYGFVTSSEFRLQAVDQWYHDYLHRDVDLGGGAFWVNLMNNGIAQSAAQASLLGGGEYAAQPFYNVLDFGATPNNGIEDTTQIQAAINAADAAGNSVVYIPDGVYLVDNLRVFGDHLKIIGRGTLRLKTGSAGVGVLTVDGNYNLVSHIKIDGNSSGGGHTGRAEGLRIGGDYNRVYRVEASNAYYDANGQASGQNFVIAGNNNIITETRSVNAGYNGYRQSGNGTVYRDITSLNARVKGFNASGNGVSFTVDGGYFETNAMEHPNGVTSFQVDPGPGYSLNKVVVRNIVAKGPQNSTNATTAAAKFALVNDLVIENSSFLSTAPNHSSLRLAEGLGKVTLRRLYMNRNLVMQQDTGFGTDDPIDELYMEACTIGDGLQNPVYAMERVVTGKLTMVNCELIGFWGAGIDWQTANNGYTVIDVRGTLFRGNHATRTTYDIMTNGVGVLTPAKITWQGNTRANAGGGAAAYSN